MHPDDTPLADVLVSALQVAVGVVFLVALVSKVRRPAEFREAVRAYQLMSPSAARIVAIVLTPIELLIAVAFLSGFVLQFGAALAGLSLLVFLAAVFIALRRDPSIPCGCFGNATEYVSKRSVARLAMLLAASILVAISVSSSRTAPFAPQSYIFDGEAGLRYVISVGAVTGFFLIASLWILTLPELLALARRHTRDGRTPRPAAITER